MKNHCKLIMMTCGSKKRLKFMGRRLMLTKNTWKLDLELSRAGGSPVIIVGKPVGHLDKLLS